MIEVLIFDLGKVIIDFDFQRSIEAVLAFEPASLPRIREVMEDHDLLVKYETGQISSVEFYRKVCGQLGLVCSMEEFKRIWGAMFLPEPLLSEEFLFSLAQRYKLLLLSNTSELHFNYVWENYPILRFFSGQVLSYRERSMKPDDQIYRAAIQAAQVNPRKIFFTDDRLENVEAAIQMGIQAVHFQSEQQLKDRMADLGILRQGAGCGT
jgi:putative hydrolase of the HAD superfamily